MADIRRIVDLLIDVSRGQPVVAEGSEELAVSNILQSVYRGDQALFRCKLYVENQNTPFAPDAASTWLFGIDKDFALDQTDLVVSENDQFNIAGDWDDISVAGGIICWRADFSTDALKTDLAALASKTMYACLWMTPPAGKPVLIAQWQLIVNNIAVDPTTAVAQDGITFVQSDMYEADRAQLMAPTGGLYRIRNGALQLKNATTNKYQTAYLTGAEGSEQMAFGPGED